VNESEYEELKRRADELNSIQFETLEPVTNMGSIALVVMLIVITLLVTLFFIGRLKRVPPNRLLVIYGTNSSDDEFSVFDQGSHIVWPVIQDYAYLSKEPQTVSLKNGEKMVVQTGSSRELQNSAAQRLLGLNTSEIDRLVIEIFETSDGNLESVKSRLAEIGLVVI
jgi:flotillin